MNVIIKIFFTLFLVLFWAAVLSFGPSMIYLILNPLYSIRAEHMAKKKIFLLKEEVLLRKEKKGRLRGISHIYSICLWLIIFAGILNWSQKGVFNIQPFDILSSLSVVLFCFAVLTYLPFAAYLIIKEPWKYKEEGAVFTKIFVIYGLSILVFSLLFAGSWFMAHDIFFGLGDFFKTFFILFISAVILAYLPVLIYVFFVIKNPFRQGNVNIKIVFLIYCLCFVLFSVIYIINWYSDRRHEVQTSKDNFLVYKKPDGCLNQRCPPLRAGHALIDYISNSYVVL